MNILIPHSWLLEYLETNQSPTEIQKQLSLCGPSVERIYDKAGESVFDIEVTTNRVDMMSVEGIAREAAVILPGAKLTSPTIPAIPEAEGETVPLPKIVSDDRFCKRVMCVVLKNVKRTPTPDWMAKRLLDIDQNIHDSAIDLTNYITHELGHPCHAFDYDQVMKLGGVIKVVEAKKGKKFTTLDGVEYTTVGGEIVFENEQGEIIDLPAIKGTLNTSLSESTTNVLLWIESLDAKKVRFASMTHAIRTVAAQLNEKNVDPHLADRVLERGVQLYQELCQAQVASPVYDSFPGEKKVEPVTLELQTIHDYLGLELPLKQITDILEKLGCQVKVTQSKLIVSPPTYRPDLAIPADIVEEVARIYGYHNLPSVLMNTSIPLIKPEGVNFQIENRFKRFLAAIGWQEVYTYSMVSEVIALQSGLNLAEHLKLQNPLTDDRVYLRRSLLPSLDEIIATNPQRTDLSVFEIAYTYQPKAGDLPDHVLELGMVSTSSYRTLRGIVESVLQQCFIEKMVIEPDATPQTGFVQSATIMSVTANSREIGRVGILANGHAAATLSLKNVLVEAGTHPYYQPTPKTSSIIEDLTFTIPAGTSIGLVLDRIQSAHSLVSKVELLDVYQQNFTFTITYHDNDKNLTDVEIAPIRKHIVAEVEKKYGAQLVGQL